MTRTHPLERIESVLLVGIGGFAGSNFRYFVDLLAPSSLTATATANVLGCFAIGFVLYEERYGGTFSRSSRTVLASGFVASFTTYSTFVVDVVVTAPVVALAYVVGSYTLGFAAVLFGRESARWVTDAVAPAVEVRE